MVAGEFAAMTSKDEGKIQAFYDKYYTPDAFFIRPSGNPLDQAGAKAMWMSPDVTIEINVLKSVDTTKVLACGAAAIATYTCHQKFQYKGTDNDDVAKMSATFEKVDGTWKLAQAHRATGQPSA